MLPHEKRGEESARIHPPAARSGCGAAAMQRRPYRAADRFSSTETSGSSQNAHTAAPKTSRHAATMNGATHEPSCTRKPKTSGDKAPPMFPAMFITPDTVPEYLPPTCIGTAHDGPIVHSRKNIAPVRQPIAA